MKKHYLKLIMAIFLFCNNPVTVLSINSQGKKDSSDTKISIFYLLIAIYSIFMSKGSLRN